MEYNCAERHQLIERLLLYYLFLIAKTKIPFTTSFEIVKGILFKIHFNSVNNYSEH